MTPLTRHEARTAVIAVVGAAVAITAILGLPSDPSIVRTTVVHSAIVGTTVDRTPIEHTTQETST